jgi:hypothetical protein
MKERLRALFNKYFTKLEPVLSKLKEGKEVRLQRRGRFLKTIKIFTAVAVLLILTAIGGITYFLKSHDPNENRAWILANLNEILPAEEISLGSISWSFSAKDVSLGLQLKDLNFVRAHTFEKVKFPDVRIFVNFWKAFFSSDPIRIVARAPEILVRETIEPSKPVEKSAWAETHLAKWPAFVTRVLRKNSGVKFEIENGTLTMIDRIGADGKKEIFHLRDLRVQSRFGGFPGSVDVSIRSELQIENESEKLVVLGPWRGKIQGYSSGSPTSIFSLKLTDVNFDFSDINFAALNIFEKSLKNPLQIQFRGNLQFKDTIFLSPLDSLELLDGKFIYNPLVITFELKKASESPEYHLDWNLPKAARSGIYLPLKGMRSVAAEGVLDSTGDVIIDMRPGSSSGRWRVGINNLKVDMKEFGREFAIENAGGSFLVSNIFEGEYKNGVLYSPKSEIHIDGAASRFALAGGEFSKPFGDTMTASARILIEKDTVHFKDLKLQMNTLDMDAHGTWANYWADENSPLAPKLTMSFKTNTVNLSDWSSYLQSFRSVPLQGFVEAAGGFTVETRKEKMNLENLEWRFDRLNLTNLRGSLDDLAFSRSKLFNNQRQIISGPFSANLVFVGRGKSWIADRAKIMGHLDLREAVISFSDSFRKPVGIPADINLSIEQLRNRAEVRSARIAFNDLELDLQGSLVRGAPNSRVQVVTKKPMNFANWAKFYTSNGEGATRIENGKAQWNGSLLLPAKVGMEEDFDWREIAIRGALELKDLEIAGKQLATPVLIADAKINFDENLLSIPNISFLHSGKKGSLALELRPRGTQKMSLGEFFKNESWDARGALDIDVVDLPKTFGPSDTEQIKFPNLLSLPVVIPVEWFKNSYVQKSHLDLRLSIADLRTWNSPLKAFVSELDWNGRTLKLQRFSTQVFGGTVSGSFLSDFSPMFDREDLPQHSATLELRRVDWGELEKNFLGQKSLLFNSGLFGGQLTFTADGLAELEWQKSFRARLEGDIANAKSSLSASVGKSLEKVFLVSEIRDYAIKDFTHASCGSSMTQAKIDAQLSSSELRYDVLKLWTHNGNRMELSGVSGAEGGMNLSGKFTGSTQCYRGDLRSCMKSLKGFDGLNLRARGNSSSPELTFYNLPKISDIRSCVTALVSSRVQQQILKESTISN